jgi:hypothetical protein
MAWTFTVNSFVNGLILKPQNMLLRYLGDNGGHWEGLKRASGASLHLFETIKFILLFKPSLLYGGYGEVCEGAAAPSIIPKQRFRILDGGELADIHSDPTITLS